MRGRVFLPLTSVLAIVTAVTLLGAAAAVTDTGAEPCTDERTKAIVRGFYDAVNVAIRTDDLSPLTRLISDDVVVHRSVADAVWDRDALWRYLAELRAESPDLRIMVDDLLADRDRVVARIRLLGVAQGALLAVPLVEGTGWGATDVFRIEDDLIVEYGGASADLGPARPLLSGVFHRGFDGPAFLGLARLSFGVETQIPVLVGSSPAIYAVESGALTIRIDGVGFLARAGPEGASATPEPTTRGRSVTLGPGDRVTIGPGVSYTLSAETGDGAMALAASVLPIAALEPTAFSNAGVTPSLSLSVAMFDVASTGGQPVPAPPGVRIQPLLGGTIPQTPGAQLPVSFVSVTLAPGTLVGDREAGGVELVAVESGSALLRSAATTLEHADEIAVLTAGTTTVLEAGEIVSIRNPGDAPLTVVVARIEPVDAAAA